MISLPSAAARYARVRRRARAQRVAATWLAVAAVLLAGCSTAVVGDPQRADPAATASGSAAPGGITVPSTPSGGTPEPAEPTEPTGDPAPVPAGLESYYAQTLSWGSCADLAQTDDQRTYYSSRAVECAYLTVPLTYEPAASPTDPTVSLAVVRKPATDPSGRIGSVVVNPGGPGGSGVDLVAQYGAFGVGGDLNRDFDLVGFDPRGVGASIPGVLCQTDAERDADRAAAVRVADQADVDAANARAQAFAQGCASRTGQEQGIDGATFLGTLGTRDVVRDMDILRAALGDNRLTYLGYSYGTLLGTVYAEQFGPNVRAMVLDGAVDPVQDSAESNLDQAKGFQSAFDDFAAWCAGRPACVLGTDPATATPVFQSLTRPLLDQPLTLADGRVLTYSDAITGTIQAMYSETFWPALADALLALSQGKGDPLMALADAYLQRDARGHYSSLQDAFTAIGCMDNPREDADAATLAARAAEAAAAAPFADSGEPPLVTEGPCDFWPAEPTLDPHVPEVDGLAPVLVISTTGDPATPYQAGVDLAEQLGGRLLTVEGTRHTAYLNAGLSCVDDAATEYLVDLTLPPDGTTCS